MPKRSRTRPYPTSHGRLPAPRGSAAPSRPGSLCTATAGPLLPGSAEAVRCRSPARAARRRAGGSAPSDSGTAPGCAPRVSLGSPSPAAPLLSLRCPAPRFIAGGVAAQPSSPAVFPTHLPGHPPSDPSPSHSPQPSRPCPLRDARGAGARLGSDGRWQRREGCEQCHGSVLVSLTAAV